MAYFDDPAHKAQWEKELAALREEKQRRMNSGSARDKRREAAEDGSAKLPSFEELVRQAAERHESKNLRKSVEIPRSDRRERSDSAEGGIIRERITFAQLLAEEENRRQLTTADKGRENQRTMEAGNAL